MKLTITNKSRGAVGVRPISGYREIERGQEWTGEFSDAEANNLRGNSLVGVADAGEEPASEEPQSDLDLLRSEASRLDIPWADSWSVARLRKEIKKAGA